MKRILSLVLAFCLLMTTVATADLATPTDLEDQPVIETPADPEVPAEDEPAAPEETEEAVEAFVPAGYVQVARGAVVYADEAMTEEIGSFTKASAVYAYTQEASGVKKATVTAIAFAAEGAAVYGYVRTSKLSALEDAAYAPKADASYQGIALENAEFAVKTEEPTEVAPIEETPAE